MSELVRVSVADGIGELVLNRPARRNALTGPLVAALHDGLTGLIADGECRVVLLRGTEGYFCAGLDVQAFAAEPPPPWRAGFADDWAALHEVFFASPKPIVGALEGFAIAAGSALALACDFLVVGDSAFLHVAEAERGMAAPMNVAWLVVRHGVHEAMRLVLLAERQGAAALVQAGIAERCVADDAVVAEARALGRRLAGLDPRGLSVLRRSIMAAAGADGLSEVLRRAKAVA